MIAICVFGICEIRDFSALLPRTLAHPSGSFALSLFECFALSSIILLNLRLFCYIFDYFALSSLALSSFAIFICFICICFIFANMGWRAAVKLFYIQHRNIPYVSIYACPARISHNQQNYPNLQGAGGLGVSNHRLNDDVYNASSTRLDCDVIRNSRKLFPLTQFPQTNFIFARLACKFHSKLIIY